MNTISVDPLADSISATHRALSDRLERAIGCQPTWARPRGPFQAADPFLASTSRHVAAVNAALLPVVRHQFADGHHRAREFVRQSKRLELSMAQVKAKLYGSTYAVRRPWGSIWAEVERELTSLQALEVALVADLAPTLDEKRLDALTDRLYRTEHRVPTRPHPYLPHAGIAGRLARGVAVRVDRFWDTAEGRMLPEPLRPHHRDHGPMLQYLLADPQLTVRTNTSNS